MSKTINLDHAAGAPLNKAAKKAVKEFLDSDIYNTDASYAPATELRRNLSDLKNKTAKLIGTKSPNIYITSGSSDATSTLFEVFKLSKNKGALITTNLEHSSLLDLVPKNSGHHILKIQNDGTLDLKELTGAITSQTLLLSIQYVNNETGQIMPIKEISKIVKQAREVREREGNKLPIFLHTDASQAAITQDIQVPRLGVDAMSLNGSKFGALPNSGLLYISSDILRWLNQSGISMPPRKESPLSVISTYHALGHAIEKKNSESKRLLAISKTFWAEFQSQVPSAHLNPKNLKIGKNHSAHILNIHVPGISGERLVILAGLNGILISTGAACSASKDKPSHVLEALGLRSEVIQSSIRVSFGSSNQSEKDAKDAAKKLASLCQNSSVRLT